MTTMGGRSTAAVTTIVVIIIDRGAQTREDLR